MVEKGTGKPRGFAFVEVFYVGGIVVDGNDGGRVVLNLVARMLTRQHAELRSRVNLMIIQRTQLSQSCFPCQFDDYDPVDKIILEKTHKIKDHSVEVKKATPRNADVGPGPMMGGGGRGKSVFYG